MNSITVKKHYEYWQTNGSECVFFTRDIDVKNFLRKLLGPGATYERKGKVFAWHFVVPKYEAEAFKRRIASLGQLKLDVEDRIPIPALKTSQNRQLSAPKNDMSLFLTEEVEG